MESATTEQPVELPDPIPVYLIYQTAASSGDQIVFYQDIYGHDARLGRFVLLDEARIAQLIAELDAASPPPAPPRPPGS